MKPSPFARLALWLALGVALPAPALAAELFAVGDAAARVGGELAYREYHCVEPGADRRVVRYRNVDGELIAIKTIDYSSGRTTPSFEQNNLAQGRTVALDYADGKLASRRQNADDVEASEIEFDPARLLVIDAGFDEFIRQQWDSIAETGGVQFQFPLASEGSMVDLRIQPANCTAGAESDRCFALEPANWLIRLVAGSIELGYDSQTRQLTRFSGRSNLPDRNGNGFDVDIRYRYDSADAGACSTEGSG